MHNSEDIKISRKKLFYPVTERFDTYLKLYDRKISSPIVYEDLLRFIDHYPIMDINGNDTLWEGVIYSYHEMSEIHESLKKVYQRLISDGNQEVTSHLFIDSIDYCTFGNSHPFRIKIKNQFNDNYDYFYVKRADASRIYGLELEYLLSPNRINFLLDGDTLIEEHIPGIPGDVFIKDHMGQHQNKIRLAKEFVKFNERCFLRLLGDQRAYNFVIVLTPDFDQMQYRIRSIDFDQQSYEGKMNLYKPQFFRENLDYVKMVIDNLDEASIKQYQHEERSIMAKRMLVGKKRLSQLLGIMKTDNIAPQDKMENLRDEVFEYLKDNNLKKCNSMGDIVSSVLEFTLRNYQNSLAQK